MKDHYDALIIGAGPAGASAAGLLARQGWKVVLVEKSAFPRRKVCGEYVSATSLPLFRRLGVDRAFVAQAGPEVRRVGLFAQDATVIADLPRPRRSGDWGRALGREHLDLLLAEQARAAGAEILQPWAAESFAKVEEGFVCRLAAKASGETREVRSRCVIAAHGSWDPGKLATQRLRHAPKASDLFGFKAHFHNSLLELDLMPLLVFPGGYGGLVHTDGGRLSLSCCIRRDWLERLRRAQPGLSAGEAVLGHIRAWCLGARRALVGARLDGPWLSAGPIRPGMRACAGAGVFLIGNAAGEAHPVIAEGISMAVQSAWLLCEQLAGIPAMGFGTEAWRHAEHGYQASWRRQFAVRIHASMLFAHLASRPIAVFLLLPFLRQFPGLLALGAKVSGKARSLESLTSSSEGWHAGPLEPSQP